jgi:FkbM family methyltransferase
MEKKYQTVEYFRDSRGVRLGESTATIFYGQCGEDLEIYVDFISKDLEFFKDTGTYIEIGASDGVKYSNSKFFEDELGFSGILIEPLPNFFDTLKQTRPNNRLYNCAVSEEGDSVDVFYSSRIDGYRSGMTKTMASAQKKEAGFNDSEDIISVPAKKMSDIMNEIKLERIDIFSIDVEGGEYEVLATIDWNIPIYLFIIELAVGEEETQKDINCRNLMKDKGYHFHKRVGISEIWYDPFYFEKVK